MFHFNLNGKAIFALMVVVGLVAAIADGQQTASSETLGMNCKTHGDFKFCEGKGANYNRSEAKITPKSDDANAGSVHSRQFGDVNPVFGYLPRHRCNERDHNKCKQLNVDIVPTFLVNVRNQNRYIAQLGAIRQRVRLAICTENRCGKGNCEQKYTTVTLLAWDPDARDSKLFTDQFRIPSCCRCSRFSDI